MYTVKKYLITNFQVYAHTHLDLSHSKLTKNCDSSFFLITAGLAVDTLIKHSAQAFVGERIKCGLIKIMYW